MIANIISTSLIIALIFPGSFMPFLVFSLRAFKMSLGQRLAFSSIISFTMYYSIMVFPYYFQGYGKVYQSSGYCVHNIMPGTPLGIHTVAVFDAIAYAWTIAPAEVWLLGCLLQAGFGEFNKHGRYNGAIKATLITLVGLCLFDAAKVTGVIARVLE